MPANPKDVIKAIDKRISSVVKPTLDTATVTGIMPGYVKIRIGGSSVNRNAKLANHMQGKIQIGDEVMIARPSEFEDWIVIAATGNENRYDSLRAEMIAPPSDFTAVPFQGSIVLSWTAPVHAIMSFQIQHNTSATEVDATDEFVSSTQFIYFAPSGEETNARYFRIRSVASTLNSSGWSEWVSAIPGTFFLENVAYPMRPNISMVDICSIDDVPASHLSVLEFAAGGGGGGGEAEPQIYPQFASLFMYDFKILVGSNIAITTANGMSFYFLAYLNTPADGRSAEAIIFLKEGTYNFYTLGQKSATAGKADWYLDNSIIVSGQDWYQSYTYNNYVFTHTGISVVGSGTHVLKVVTNGKNASSSNYYLNLTRVWFRPDTLAGET